MSDEQQETLVHTLKWDVLLDRIEEEKCTPFIGAGACTGILPLGGEIARDWAHEIGYLQPDSGDLARVSQFLALKTDSMKPKEKIAKQLKNAVSLDFVPAGDSPHGILAELPLPVYITTNYDDLMFRALKNKKKTPKRVLCRWNSQLIKVPADFELKRNFNPDIANPIVFHLHGHQDVPRSLVLTEDDYLDFLVNISQDQEIIPPRIHEALTDASLLFIGYSLADWDFRVLFRGLVTKMENSLRRLSVAVQLLPVPETASKAVQKQTQQYFDDYFGKMDIQVYWGKADKFVHELKKRWESRLQSKGVVTNAA